MPRFLPERTPALTALGQHGLLVTLSIVLAGCSEMFSAHPTTVARVDDAVLTVDRLADVLVLAQPLPLERDVVLSLARHWVYVSAFARDLAERGAPADTNAALEAMWFPVRRLLISQLDIGREPGEFIPDSAAVDSAYRAGDFRMLFHILRAVPLDAPPDIRRAQRDTAQMVLESLVRGGDWADANAYNQDSVARAAAGSVGAVKRGELLPRFENAGFGLGPGELSPVTETELGFHVIYRPRLNEVRGAYGQFLSQELRTRADSLYAEQLLAAREFAAVEAGPDRVREVASDPWRAAERSSVVGTYRGGRITTVDVARYLPYVSAQDQRRLAAATRADLLSLVRDVAVQELLWNQVDSAGIELADSTRAAIYQQYQNVVSASAEGIGLVLDSLYAADVPAAERSRRAMRMVDRYFDAVASRQRTQVALPTFVITDILDDRPWEVRPQAVEHVISRTERLLAASGAAQ